MRPDKAMYVPTMGGMSNKVALLKKIFFAAINNKGHIATPWRHGPRNTQQYLAQYICGRSGNIIRRLSPHDLSLVQAIRNSSTSLPMSQRRASPAIGREW